MTDESDSDTALEAAHRDSCEKTISPVRQALLIGLAAVTVLASLTVWWGISVYRNYQNEKLEQRVLSAARDSAVNLTSIDYKNAEITVQRILNSATGEFYRSFQARAQPLIEVVKQTESISVGSVTEAGLESLNGNQGQVLVAVTVRTSNRGAVEQSPRSWRMRLTVRTIDDDAKIAQVEFVS